MSEISDRLQALRRRAGFATATDAARAFGWNENTFRSHENGERGIRPDVASKYARAFKSSLAWLLSGQGEEERGIVNRLSGAINDNGIVTFFGDKSPTADIGLTIAVPSVADLLLVFTDSLYPRYAKGDLIAVWRGSISEAINVPEKTIPIEGVAYLASNEIYLGSWHRKTAPDVLELINRPPLRGIEVKDFLPVQVVLRLGTYAMMTYGENDLGR